jgi:3',5'-cyclic-AMP phosphodiesterase
VDIDPCGDGHWSGPLDGNRLSKGEHELEAEAITEGGAHGSQRVVFIVDPTGRYTAVPEARPMVGSTAFC